MKSLSGVAAFGKERSVVVGMVELWASSMEARGRTPDTIKRRTGTLRRFPHDPLKATGIDIETWLIGLDVTPQTRGYYLGDLRAFYKWARRRGIVDTDPTALIDGWRRKTYTPRPIQSQQLARAVQLAPPRMRRILLLGSLAGARRVEVARCELEHIDWENGIVRLYGKGDKERIVPLHPLLANELERGPLTGPLALNDRGTRMSVDAVGQQVSEYLHSIDIDATGHQLRHWFGTHAYKACKDLGVVQELMGHGSMATTAGYVQFSKTAAFAAVHALTLPTVTSDFEQPTLPFN